MLPFIKTGQILPEMPQQGDTDTGPSQSQMPISSYHNQEKCPGNQAGKWRIDELGWQDWRLLLCFFYWSQSPCLAQSRCSINIWGRSCFFKWGNALICSHSLCSQGSTLLACKWLSLRSCQQKLCVEESPPAGNWYFCHQLENKTVRKLKCHCESKGQRGRRN